MASPTDLYPQENFSDVRKVGYLRKPKTMHKRFFVLRAASDSGLARLEYYENEKKWRHKSGAPKRSIPLENCLNINKRADSKNKHLVALYTKDECFAIAADCEQEQEGWYQALVDLHNRGKTHSHHNNHDGAASGVDGVNGEDVYGEMTPPGLAFKEVWQVIMKPKGLGQIKNVVGTYRLCLTSRTISLVKLNSDAAAVVLQLMNIRRCGHSENFFFIEVGRSAVTGSGEFWMQVDDSVVAQNMHETILEAMKALSEDFRPRSKSQSSSNCSNPISVPLRRHHLNHPPPSQVGLNRRARTESVTATSPAGGAAKHGTSSSFRVRASSDGEGTMSRPASMDGSPASPSANRAQSHRHRGSARLHPPLNHSRSIPTPAAHCSPSATSPVSLSSSSTSGHGSTSDCLFPRRSSASVSGSPSDGGFISSDEYGSSPCDFRSSFRSVTPDSLGHTPPAQEEDLSNYICMGKPSSQIQKGLQQRYHSSRGEEHHDLDKVFRKRTHSSGTSPPTVSHQKTPSQSSIEEYTEMMPSYPLRLSSFRHSAFVPTYSYPEECLDLHLEANRINHTDDGYMPMSPGVAPVPPKSNDYMPMSPKSVSAPQQIINPRRHSQVDSNGYMMMSPSGSCSPDTANYCKIWTNGTNPKLSMESNDGKLPCNDYINMSPASGSTTSTPPDCYLNTVEEPPKPVYSYFSLPRSFKHAHRKNENSHLRMSANAGHHLYAEDSSSSSTSSDSLGGQDSQQTRKGETCLPGKRLTRPTRLSLETSKASTLPRAREPVLPPEPKSPGEYVNIEFSDKAFSGGSLSSMCSLPYVQSRVVPQRENLSEYMNMDLGVWRAKTAYASCASTYKPTCKPASSLCSPDICSSSRPPVRAKLVARDSMSMQNGTLCSDYSQMTPSRITARATSSSSKSNYAEMSIGGVPEDSSAVLSTPNTNLSETLHSSLLGQGSGPSAFTRVSLSPSRNQSAKVIRAGDSQGRRRHSSETFSSTPTTSRVSAGPVSGEDVKRHSSASFENVWLRSGDTARRESLQHSDHLHNGLNYIDLDLAKDLSVLEHCNSHQTGASHPSDDLSAYASITFHKLDEHRSQAENEE
ncbi:insulin receptor substrate 1 isoform X1 [Pelobates cultripes]|uniref:Insulin receptor substrate 1 isoform X1 n=1 Tax=Pelobates cultripes TaxID=61616 RepID=A0AAD1RBV6_PELCU|nr:insulin receptor substrate 1 isoform X1 [Pelobates cultripes]